MNIMHMLVLRRRTSLNKKRMLLTVYSILTVINAHAYIYLVGEPL